jgi:hypothetical protein
MNYEENEQKILMSIDRMTKWQRVLFSAACAERVAPMYRRMAVSEHAEIFENALTMVWSSCKARSEPHEIDALVLRLDKALYEGSDEPNKRDYYGTRSGNTVFYALSGIQSEDGAREDTISAFFHEIDIADQLDGDQVIPFEKKRLSGGTLAPGPVVNMTVGAQLESIEMILGHKDIDQDLVDSVRLQVRQYAEKFDELVVTLEQKYKWWD